MNDDSIVTHTHCYVLSVLLTGQEKKKQKKKNMKRHGIRFKNDSFTQDNVTLLFFPDCSPATAARRKSFIPVLRTMTALSLQPFLAYPALIKLRHGVSREVSTLLGKRRILSAPCHRRRHLLRLHKVTGRRRPPSLRPGGRGLMAGIEAMPAARKKMVEGGIWMLARSLFFFPLSSWDIVHIYPIQLSLCW